MGQRAHWLAPAARQRPGYASGAAKGTRSARLGLDFYPERAGYLPERPVTAPTGGGRQPAREASMAISSVG
jgi:hypothetical protein